MSDHSGSSQVYPVLLVISYASENFRVVLSQQRRSPDFLRRFTEVKGQTGVFQLTSLRMLNHSEELPLPLLGTGEHLRRCVVGGHRNPVGLALPVQPVFGVLAEPSPQPAVEFGAVGGRVTKMLFPGPFRIPQELDQALPLAGLQGQQLNVAVLGRHDPADAEKP